MLQDRRVEALLDRAKGVSGPIVWSGLKGLFAGVAFSAVRNPGAQPLRNALAAHIARN